MSAIVNKVCCPACGKIEGVWISYGYTAGMAHLPDHVYGGCNMSDGRPDRACLACGHSWGMLMTEKHPDGKRTKRWIDDPGLIAELLLNPEIFATVEQERERRKLNAASRERLQKLIAETRLTATSATQP